MRRLTATAALALALLSMPRPVEAQSAPTDQLAPPAEISVELSWPEVGSEGPTAAIQNPRIHEGFDDGFLYTGLSVLISGYVLGIAVHAPGAVRECPPPGSRHGSSCNDWARPFGFLPLAHFAVMFVSPGDVGSAYPITGGITAGIQLAGLVLLLVGALHHHPSLQVRSDGVAVAFD